MDDLERRLVLKARRGDRRALGTLYDRYRSRLYGYLLRSLRDPAVVDDVFQETWMKVLEKISSFDPERGTFRAWLFRVGSNAAVDRIRRDRIRVADELDSPAEGSDERHADLLRSDDPDPERLSAAGEAGRTLEAALEALPGRQRTAVLLRHQQGLTYAELAEAMQVAEGTAKTLVHRAVFALRELLAERGVAP